MLTQIINGHILTPQGWLKDGSVLVSDGKILEVTNSDLAVIGASFPDSDCCALEAWCDKHLSDVVCFSERGYLQSRCYLPAIDGGER